MKPVDFLILGIIAVLVGLVIWYILRSKKRGAKCIGCPDGATCSGSCKECSCGCGSK